MKLFFNLSVFLLCVLICSCGSTKKEYLLKVKLQKLSEENMFDKDLAADVIFDAKELNSDSLQTESRKLFLQGIDQFKNKKNPARAVKLFISSILIFPEAKTYYELGNALAESGADSLALANALKAYEVAEFLHFQPASSVYLQEAFVRNRQRDKTDEEKDADIKNTLTWQVINNLQMAFSNGFNDTSSLRKNPKINSILLEADYKKMVARSLNGKGNGEGLSLFAQFKRSFPVASGQFEIPVERVDMGDYKESINYDFAQFIPEMENTSFGREVSHDYFYVAKVAETENYAAIVYASVNFFGGEMQPVNTTLVTYDAAGNIISRRLIGCQCSAEKIKTCKVENNTITVEEYKRIWESPIDKVGFSDNKVESTELVSKARYRINDKGEIMDEDVPANFKDTALVLK